MKNKGKDEYKQQIAKYQYLIFVILSLSFSFSTAASC